MSDKKYPTIKLSSLLEDLAPFIKELEHGKDYDVSFSGLTYYRPKPRGDNFLQIEFDEAVARDSVTGRVTVQTLE